MTCLHGPRVLEGAKDAKSRSREQECLVQVRCVKRGDRLDPLEPPRELTRRLGLCGAELILDVLDRLESNDTHGPR